MKLLKTILRRFTKTRGFEKVMRAKIDESMLCKERGVYVYPQRGTDGSACYDFTLPWDVYIRPNEVVKVPCGFKAYMKKREVLKIFPRSGMSTNLRVTLANDVPIIDSDFYDSPENEGEITLALLNEGDKPIRLEAGDRVAQGMFEKYLIADKDKPRKKKRTGGFGSTGKGVI